MTEISKALRQFNPSMKEEDLALLLPRINQISAKKGDCLLRQGQVARYIYLIEKGGVKCYSPRRDRIIWAEFEGGFITIPNSISQQIPSEEELECLEDCSLYAIRYTDLTTLYATNLQWANWGRNFSEHWIRIMDTIYGILSMKSATDRYEAVIRLQPDILQRVSLKDLASFLGISQVSISRIRANTQVKAGN
ncbi:MAG: cyclic nucleotide-binding domain-containing protein [Bacteroidota bacterium]